MSEHPVSDGSVSHTSWLVRRAALAIGLMVGFYVLAIGIAVGLLWIPYAEWAYLGRVHLKILALCGGAALAVLWAIVPRFDRFEPPGPRLEESACPRLFEAIRDVAAATHQEMPSEIYLVEDVNAWVTHRGGVMGFGSRRVMGIGLPLLQALSVAELKAILAHEFGHYSAGDVKVGPWIYKTRAAIGRAIEGVHETLFEAPFQWYGRLFLRLTHAVSRQQEYLADRIAASVAGVHAMSSALRQVTALSVCHGGYFRNEVGPVLQAGFLPPLAVGFHQFLQSERIASAARRIVEEAEASDETDAFDTHPSLRDRLAALERSGLAASVPGQSEPAAALVPDVDALAASLIRFAVGEEAFAALKPIDWDGVGESVYLPQWRAAAARHASFLAGYTADALPSGQQGFIGAGSALVERAEVNVNSEDRIGRAVFVLAVGLALALLDDGWRVVTGPGRPLLLARGSSSMEPFGIVEALSDGSLDAGVWKARCIELGIQGRPLGVSASVAG